ncbi:Uncharacterised protein [Chlamydia trachomatis]|jgi:archaellum component FlaC|nr:Uncharacterised protein [Chlamydia trachomatis]
MIIMIKMEKKSLSEMKEKLHRMKLEVQELEDTIEECSRKENDDYDKDYDKDYDRDYDYRRRDREYDGRSRGRYRY